METLATLLFVIPLHIRPFLYPLLTSQNEGGERRNETKHGQLTSIQKMTSAHFRIRQQAVQNTASDVGFASISWTPLSTHTHTHTRTHIHTHTYTHTRENTSWLPTPPTRHSNAPKREDVISEENIGLQCSSSTPFPHLSVSACFSVRLPVTHMHVTLPDIPPSPFPHVLPPRHMGLRSFLRLLSRCISRHTHTHTHTRT